jgi:2-phospho-L-lactate/phosphoenolpyruvate guanylyltransferase
MNQPMRIWAVVPVKSFGRAKARLAPLLGPDQREELSRAMFEDVLAALRTLDRLAGILVISQDTRARQIARAAGALMVEDPLEQGPSAAIRLAMPALRDSRADAMIVVPSDVPQIKPDELLPVLESLQRVCVALVAAARDGGTNRLGCSPMDIMDPCFGPNSFAKHISAARRIGIEPQVFSCSSLRHDIDRPEDILDFCARQPTRTGAYLDGVSRMSHGADVAG